MQRDIPLVGAAFQRRTIYGNCPLVSFDQLEARLVEALTGRQPSVGRNFSVECQVDPDQVCHMRLRRYARFIGYTCWHDVVVDLEQTKGRLVLKGQVAPGGRSRIAGLNAIVGVLAAIVVVASSLTSGTRQTGGNAVTIFLLLVASLFVVVSLVTMAEISRNRTELLTAMEDSMGLPAGSLRRTLLRA